MFDIHNMDGFGYSEDSPFFECMMDIEELPNNMTVDDEFVKDGKIRCNVLGAGNDGTIEEAKAFYIVDCSFPDSNYPSDFHPMRQEVLIWQK